MIACECSVCTSTDPRDTRTRTGAALIWEGPDSGGATLAPAPGGRPRQQRVVLIDTTPDLRQQAIRHGLHRCDAILFTHNHVDHIFGLDEVRRFNAVMKLPIDVYAEPPTMDSLRRVYKHIFEASTNVNVSFVAELIPWTLEPRRPIDLFGMRITPIRLLHGRLPIVGFRIEPDPARNGAEPREGSPYPLAYCTDVSGIPPESWKLLEGLNTLVLDGLRIRKHPTHFNLDQAIDAAQRIGAKQTWLIHIAHEILHEKIDGELPPGISLAYDGLVLG